MIFNLFKKNKEGKRTGNQYLSLKVREVVKETEDAVSLYFEQSEPYMDYKPGQFLTVILDLDGKEERRSYSLCTSPYVDPFPGITIKRIKNGLMSNYLNDHIRPGKTLELMQPLGHFTTEYHSKNKIQYIMVAGGSGITPLMGISKSILVNEPDSEILLIYCNRNDKQVIFRKQLEDLQLRYPGKLNIVFHYSQQDSTQINGSCRLDGSRIRDLIAKGLSRKAEKFKYLTCGPEGLMDSALTALEEMGVEKGNILKESFYTKREEKHSVPDLGIAPVILTREVTVILEGNAHSFDVPPDKFILEAGLEENIDMPYSCQSGLCTACRGRLLSGQVRMEEDAGLSENEINEGYVLCCVSHPLTADVKINIE